MKKLGEFKTAFAQEIEDIKNSINKVSITNIAQIEKDVEQFERLLYEVNEKIAKQEQRICNLDKSLSEGIVKKAAVIEENMSVLQHSMESRIEENKSVLEASISNLQQETDSKIKEIENAGQRNKSEMEESLAEQKAFAGFLDSKMSANVESMEQRICNLDKSLSEDIAKKAVAIEENMSVLQHSMEFRIEENKSVLEASISNLQQETESKITELEKIETNDKEELLKIIAGLKSELALANEQNCTKFKWAYCIACASLAINIVLITLHACGIL